jgi:hypothetical protein
MTQRAVLALGTREGSLSCLFIPLARRAPRAFDRYVIAVTHQSRDAATRSALHEDIGKRDT